MSVSCLRAECVNRLAFRRSLLRRLRPEQRRLHLARGDVPHAEDVDGEADD